jgi:hypothetical protein
LKVTPRLGRVNGHRLFADGVAAKFHRTVDVEMVRRVHAGHDHHIGFGLSDHTVELVGVIGRERRRIEFVGDALVIPVHARLAEVTQPHHDGRFAILAADGVDIHFGATPSADKGVPFALVGHEDDSISVLYC